MINDNKDFNGSYHPPANDEKHRGADGEIGGLFGSSIVRMVSQYQAVLRQGLDKEIQKIVDDFQKASVGSNEMVAKRMRTRIEDLVSEEVRRVFDNTLYRAQRTFTDPIRALAADFDGLEVRKRGGHDRTRRRGRQTDENSRSERVERDRGQSQPTANQNPGSRISGSVPDGYPQRKMDASGHDVSPTADRHAFEAQEVPNDHAAQTPVGRQTEREWKEAGTNDGTAQASPATWVLPGPTPVQEDVSPSPSAHDEAGDISYLTASQSGDTSFEPDDEIDPFIASLDDGLTPDAAFVPAEETEETTEEMDTSELPDNALTAVLSENTDFTAIAHDSREVVHVPSSNEPFDDDVESGDMHPAEEVASVEDEADGGAEDRSMDADIPEAEASNDESESENEIPSDSIEEHLDISTEETAPTSETATPPEITDDKGPADDIEGPDALPVGEVEDVPVADSDEEERALEEDGETITAASETHDAPAQEESNSQPEANEAPQGQVDPQPVSVDAQPVQELPGSVEIEGEQGEDAELPETTTFEGTVRLNVEAQGCIKEIVHLVRELRQKPELRLLRLVGNNKEGVDIWLGLREPLRIRSIMPEIEGVSITVRPLPHVGGQDEKLLGVRMTRIVAAETVSEVS